MIIIEYLISAAILGFVVAIPPGSVTIVAGQRAVLYGFTNSLVFSLGSCFSDIFYLILVYTGVAHLIADNVTFKLILWIVCGLILIFLGVSSIVSVMRRPIVKSSAPSLSARPAATFFSGVLVTLTNPMTIIGWIAVAGNYLLIWKDRFPEAERYGVAAIVCIMLGVLLWFIPLIFIISKIKKLMNDGLVRLLVILSSLFLLAFGVMAFYFAFELVSRAAA